MWVDEFNTLTQWTLHWTLHLGKKHCWEHKTSGLTGANSHVKKSQKLNSEIWADLFCAATATLSLGYLSSVCTFQFQQIDIGLFLSIIFKMVLIGGFSFNSSTLLLLLLTCTGSFSCLLYSYVLSLGFIKVPHFWLHSIFSPEIFSVVPLPQKATLVYFIIIQKVHNRFYLT